MKEVNRLRKQEQEEYSRKIKKTVVSQDDMLRIK